MSQYNDSWNKKWQAQMDKAHSELLSLLAQKRELEEEIRLIDLRTSMQLAMMELIASQIKPPE